MKERMFSFGKIGWAAEEFFFVRGRSMGYALDLFLASYPMEETELLTVRLHNREEIGALITDTVANISDIADMVDFAYEQRS